MFKLKVYYNSYSFIAGLSFLVDKPLILVSCGTCYTEVRWIPLLLTTHRQYRVN